MCFKIMSESEFEYYVVSIKTRLTKFVVNSLWHMIILLGHDRLTYTIILLRYNSLRWLAELRIVNLFEGYAISCSVTIVRFLMLGSHYFSNFISTTGQIWRPNPTNKTYADTHSCVRARTHTHFPFPFWVVKIEQWEM